MGFFNWLKINLDRQKRVIVVFEKNPESGEIKRIVAVYSPKKGLEAWKYSIKIPNGGVVSMDVQKP